MDTTANSLARILQLLAENPDAQERLRDEIAHAVEADGVGDTLEFDATYEQLDLIQEAIEEHLEDDMDDADLLGDDDDPVDGDDEV